MTTITEKSSVYARWMDVSTRLINIMDVTPARKDKIMYQVRSFIRNFEDEEIHGWDTYTEYKFYGRIDVSGIADDTNHFGEFWLDGVDEPKWNSFYNQISVVTRAGLDLATQEWGGGVVGYSIGDLRKAYDGQIPDWMCNALELTGDEDDDMGVWL